MAGDGAAWLERRGLYARTVIIKVRYSDFETITRSHCAEPTRDRGGAGGTGRWRCSTKTEAGVRPVRLLGASVHNLSDTHGSAAAPRRRGADHDCPSTTRYRNDRTPSATDSGPHRRAAHAHADAPPRGPAAGALPRRRRRRRHALESRRQRRRRRQGDLRVVHRRTVSRRRRRGVAQPAGGLLALRHGAHALRHGELPDLAAVHARHGVPAPAGCPGGHTGAGRASRPTAAR